METRVDCAQHHYKIRDHNQILHAIHHHHHLHPLNLALALILDNQVVAGMIIILIDIDLLHPPIPPLMDPRMANCRQIVHQTLPPETLHGELLEQLRGLEVD
jgi:hypothetical protein